MTQESFDFDLLQMTEKNVFTENMFNFKAFLCLDFWLLLDHSKFVQKIKIFDTNNHEGEPMSPCLFFFFFKI